MGRILGAANAGAQNRQSAIAKNVLRIRRIYRKSVYNTRLRSAATMRVELPGPSFGAASVVISLATPESAPDRLWLQFPDASVPRNRSPEIEVEMDTREFEMRGRNVLLPDQPVHPSKREAQSSAYVIVPAVFAGAQPHR
jgi:hypothetical protein